MPVSQKSGRLEPVSSCFSSRPSPRASIGKWMKYPGYASRSELVRDMIREKLVEERWAGEHEDVFGVLTISYDHHQRGLTEKINHIQHHSYINVLCTTHVHLDHHHCLETIIVRGKPDEIEQLVTRIGGMRGVRFSKLTRASIPAM